MVTVITSKQNAGIKRIASLKEKKYRNLYGEYLVEGIKSVKEAVLYGQNVSVIIGVKEVVDILPPCGADIIVTDEKIIEYLSDTKTPQGVLAVIKIPENAQKSPKNNCVILDGVQDPGNLGTIIRTCAALGIKDLFLCSCADPYSPKVVRSSMSGIFSVNVIEGTREEIASLTKDLNVVIADMNGENVFKARVKEPYALVIGNEANGVSEFFKSKADKVISLPMKNTVESLNAAVAFSVIAYTLYGKKFGC